MENRKSKLKSKPGEPRKNPYKGLFYYEESDREMFYGRETEKRKLFRLVEHNLLTVVFGKSGIGKTSLLNAGLFPGLRDKGFLPIRLRPDYSASAPPPREQIRNIITGELKRCGVHETGKEKGGAQPFGPGETLWEYFHRVNHGDDTGKKSITPVLVFDQFEEIFTLGKSNPGINQLIDELYCLIEDQVPDALNEQLLRGERKFSYTGTELNARVVISLREDYLPDLSSLKARFPSIDRVMFRVIRLNGKQAGEIIGMPGGLRDEDVINNILHVFQPDGEGGNIPDEKLEIEPSILSLLCFQLFEKQEVQLITRADQDKILTDFYNSVLKKFSGEVNKFVESKLLTEGGFRTPFYLEKDHKLRGPIERLINERVVRKVYYDEKEHIEIIHDVLTPIIKEKRNRRIKKTKNAAIAILSFLLAVFVFLTFYAYIQKKIADEQLVRSLISAARFRLSTDNIEAIRIAEASYEKAPSDLISPVMQVLSDAAASTYERPFPTANMQHDHTVKTAVFSPDGTQILTASEDGTAKRWDLNGNRLKTYEHNGSFVNSAVFSPDGTQILTASRDGTAKRWNLNGNCLKTYRHNGSFVNSAVFSPDGKKIITASADKTAKLWDLNGDGVVIYEHSDIVSIAKFSPDGTKILTVSWDNTAGLWDIDGTLLKTYQHRSFVNSAEFSPDGKEILTASDDRTAKLWDLEGNLKVDLNKHNDTVWHAVFSPDGSRILTASNDGTARLWDSNGELLKDYKHTSSVNSVEFSRDGKKIITASDDRSARLWDLNGRLLKDCKHTTSVKSVGFSWDGEKIVTVSNDRSAKLWDFERQLLYSYSHTSPVNSVEFSPDKSRFVTASDDNTAKLWDLNGNLLKDFRHTDAVNTGTFSPDGHKILTASKDNTARLWDLKGKLLKEFHHTDAVKTAVFSPDGKKILTASRDKTAKLWDLEGNLTADLNKHTGSVGSAVFSPDGTRILTASIDKTAKLWDLEGRLLVNLKHKSPVGIAIFSPDGNKILTAPMDNTVKLWDLTGRLTADLDTFKSPVVFAVFSPDGDKILTASMDNTAKLWDLEGNRLAVYNHSGWIHSAVFSPDGNWVLTASDDKTAGLWDLDGNLAAKLNKHTGTVRRAVFSPDGTRILTASDDRTAKLRYTPEAIYEWLKTANIPQLSKKEKKELGIE
jgi:WD40 repeat protein